MSVAWTLMSHCFGDSKNVFKSKIGQVVNEKNAYELDAAIHCLYSVHNDHLPLYCPFFALFRRFRKRIQDKKWFKSVFWWFYTKMNLSQGDRHSDSYINSPYSATLVRVTVCSKFRNYNPYRIISNV
jgi:hypothetical protein